MLKENEIPLPENFDKHKFRVIINNAEIIVEKAYDILCNYIPGFQKAMKLLFEMKNTADKSTSISYTELGSLCEYGIKSFISSAMGLAGLTSLCSLKEEYEWIARVNQSKIAYYENAPNYIKSYINDDFANIEQLKDFSQKFVEIGLNITAVVSILNLVVSFSTLYLIINDHRVDECEREYRRINNNFEKHRQKFIELNFEASYLMKKYEDDIQNDDEFKNKIDNITTLFNQDLEDICALLNTIEKDKKEIERKRTVAGYSMGVGFLTLLAGTASILFTGGVTTAAVITIAASIPTIGMSGYSFSKAGSQINKLDEIKKKAENLKGKIENQKKELIAIVEQYVSYSSSKIEPKLALSGSQARKILEKNQDKDKLR